MILLELKGKLKSSKWFERKHFLWKCEVCWCVSILRRGCYLKAASLSMQWNNALLFNSNPLKKKRIHFFWLQGLREKNRQGRAERTSTGILCSCSQRDQQHCPKQGNWGGEVSLGGAEGVGHRAARAQSNSVSIRGTPLSTLRGEGWATAAGLGSGEYLTVMWLRLAKRTDNHSEVEMSHFSPSDSDTLLCLLWKVTGHDCRLC